MNVLGALQLGFIYALLALGLFITFRVMNTPDLTVDGSFTLGLAVSAVLTVMGHPFLALLAGFICGALAGAATGLLQTKACIHPLLAGILVMTSLYSVNLYVMGSSPNISLLGQTTIFSQARVLLGSLSKDTVYLLVVMLLASLSVLALWWFFRTGQGLCIRATGNNEAMVRASSINSDMTRTMATAIANAFVGFSGAVLVQYQGYADINSGAGIIVVGLASIIIGEVFVRRRSMLGGLAAAVLGAVIYRLLIALALHLDFFPAYMLRLVSGVIVAATLSIPHVRQMWQEHNIRREGARDAQSHQRL
jgi:putative ABC transport system permease protein